MATLTGKTVANTYKDLLQVSNSNTGIDGTLRTMEDGEGTSSALSISTDAIQVDNINLNGNTISPVSGALTIDGHAWPTSDGTSGQALTTDGAGTLSFTTISGGLTQEEVEDFAGALVATGGTKTGITITYQDSTNDMDFVVSDTTVAGDSGSTGMTPGDTLTIAGGTNVTTAMSGDTLTINATTSGDAWSDPVDSSITVDTDSLYDLGTTLARFKDAYVDSITVTGNARASAFFEAGGGVGSSNAAIPFVVSSTTTVGDWTAGTLRVDGTASAAAILALREDTDNGTNVVNIQAPASIASNRTITLPDATTTLIGDDTTDTLTNKSGNISMWTNDSGYITATLTDEQVQDKVGAMVSGNTETGIAVTYQDADGTIDFVVSDTTVAGDSGSTGMTPGDTLTIAGGTNATTAMSGDTLTINVDDAFLSNSGDTGTGAYDFGGATDFEIPNSATPTVDTAGQIAIDTTITDHTGAIKFHDGTEELMVISIPTGNLTTTDGHIIKYNATNNEFEMGAGGAGGISDILEDTTPQLGGDLDTNSFMIDFDDAHGIRDDSSNEQLIFQKTTSAVNHLEVTNAATTNSPSLTAAGDDTNIDLTLDGKGSGTVKTTSSNLDITGNIVVSGTVDGRDIATDGTKLDGIEANATADQTDEEIEDIAGPLVATGGTKTGITVTYQDATGDMDFVVSDTTVAGDSGSTGITPGDTLTIAGGTEITTAMSGDTLTINSDFTPSSTDTLTNKTFDANGTGNSLSNVDVADLANGTDGELITWDASGAPATVGVGTSGHVLTSNGAGAAPTFQAAAAGDLDWELITATTASSDATIEFSGLSSTYAAYKVIYTDLDPASDGVQVLMRTGTGAGPTYDSGASDYIWSFWTSYQAGSFNTADAADSEIQISDAVGTGTSEVANGEVTIYDPSSTSNHCMITSISTMINSSGNTFNTFGGGRRASTTAVTGIQFLLSSGNISSGEFRLYGLRNA